MKKKLLSVILAVAVAFTFSFAMVGTASADVKGTFTVTSWADDYSKATGYLGSDTANTYTFNTTRTFDESNGYIVATPSQAELKAAFGGGDEDTYTTSSVYYYDVTGAELLVNSNILPTYVDKTTFKSYTKGGIEGIKFLKPSYAVGYSATAPVYSNPVSPLCYDSDNGVYESYNKASSSSCTGMLNYTIKFSTPKDYDDESYAAQSFDIPIVFSPENEVKGTTTAPDLIGTASKTLSIKASTPAATDAKYVLDGDDETAGYEFKVHYDGEEHAITQKELAGITSTFKLYNEDTQKWEAVDKAVVKDAGKYKFKATASNSTGTDTCSKEIRVSVDKAYAHYMFKTSTTGKDYTVEGEFDPMDFIKVASHPNKQEDETIDTDAKAIEANKAELDAWFAEAYEVTATLADPDDFGNQDTSKYTLKIVSKYNKMTTEEKEAFEEKYAALINNFDLEADTSTTKTVTIKAPTLLENELTWTKATKKAKYSAKKGKLAKTKNFTIKAEATSGADVTYTLDDGGSQIKINKTTGKVTVKKGLKKGTYKVTVTAKAAAEAEGSAYDNADPISYTLKVVIK